MIILEGAQQTLSVDQIAQLYGQGQVSDGTYVWRDGMTDWLPIASVPELKAVMPAEEAEAPQEMDDAMPTAMFRPSAIPPQPKAAPRAPSGMGVPIPEPSSSGMTAMRRAGPARPDLLAAASAADPTLAAAAPPGPRPPAPPAAPRMQMQNVGGQLVIPGQKESSLMNLPTAFFMAQLGQPQRKKRLFVGIGVGAVVAVGAAIAAAKAYDSRGKEEVATSFGKLSTCLIGEPLKDRETVAQRARNIQLAVVGVALERRSKPGEPAWPARCAPEAHNLAEAAKNVGGAYAPLSASGEALAKALQEDPAATVGFREPLEKAWADAKSAELKFDKAAAGVAAAPRPASPMSDADFRALPKVLGGSFSLTALRPEPFPRDSIRFVLDQADVPDGPHVCTAQAGEEKVRCKKVPAAAAKLSPGLRLWGTADEAAKPYYFAGDKGQLGVFRPEAGEQVASVYATGASARKDGSLVLLGRSGSRDVKLVSVPAQGSAVERPLLSGNDVSSPQLTTGLFWDWAAYKTSPKATPASHLVFRKLADSASGEPGAAIDAGAIDEPTPGDGEPEPVRKGPPKKPDAAAETDDDRQMAGCRTAEATMVRLRGTQHDYVSFFQADRWSPPVKAASKGGAFTCRKNEATSVRVTPVMEQEKNWASITHARCNISGCTATSVGMKDLIPGLVEVAPIDAKSAVAADIDGKLLVVWNAGYTGGLRMRMAPADKIKEVDDTVLVDDRDEASPMKLVTVTDMRLVPSNKQALLFLATPAGVKLLRIDAEGKVTPLSTEK